MSGSHSPGSARVSRAGFGVAPKRFSIVDPSHNARSSLGETSATIRTPSLPQAAGRDACDIQSFVSYAGCY